MKYRREIDGLRALAVMPVIFFHAGFQVVHGGFVGVDVFFVISGYLITSIIVSDLEEGGFSLMAFYERRARRILPALFLVMAVCLPFAWLWLLPAYADEFFDSMAAVSVFASNLLFWQRSGYSGRRLNSSHFYTHGAWRLKNSITCSFRSSSRLPGASVGAGS